MRNPFRRRWTVYENLYRGYRLVTVVEDEASRRWTWKAAVRRSEALYKRWRFAIPITERVENPRTFVVKRLP